MIRKATTGDVTALLHLARQTFVESHGHSATTEHINDYMNRKFTESSLLSELTDENSVFFVFEDEHALIGYSKIILDCPHPDINAAPVAKLERIYILQSHHGKNIGQALFDTNKDLAIAQHQQGIWLYVWTENHRAVSFYKRNGFQVIGSYDFEIAADHTNPNHRMWLAL